MTVQVYFSTVADGSMYNRKDLADPSVIANRRTFLEAHGTTLEHTTRVAFTYQGEEAPHTRYLTLSEEVYGTGMTGEGKPADALITTELNRPLFLPVADCIAAVLYDPVHDVLMVSHLGRHSLEQDGAIASVTYLTTHFGSRPADIRVWFSAAAGKDNYPIWKLDNQGMKEAAFRQFAVAAILSDHITDTPADTTTDHSYYSYSEFLKGNRPEDGDHCVVAWMTKD